MHWVPKGLRTLKTGKIDWNVWTVNFYFTDPQNYLHIMRTFLNHITNETLDEIKTSLENFWQWMIQLSEFFWYWFVLILKRKCLVGASRVHYRESGTPSTIIYTRWSSRRYELGCDAPVIVRLHARLLTSDANSVIIWDQLNHCSIHISR